MTLKPLTRALGPLGVTSAPAVFDPSTLSGLLAWYKADSLALSDGAKVSSWPDSSGNGHNAIQVTSGNQPVYKAGVLGGKPAVRFNGSSTQLAAPDSSAFHVPQFSVFAVVNTTTAYIWGVAFMYTAPDDTWSSGWGMGMNNGNGEMLWVNNFSSHLAMTNAIPSLNTPYAYSGVYDQVAIRIYQNGTAQTHGTPTYTVATSVPVGGSLSLGAAPKSDYWLTGDIAEAIYYDHALTDADRHRLEAYLGTKYGLSMAVQ